MTACKEGCCDELSVSIWDTARVAAEQWRQRPYVEHQVDYYLILKAKDLCNGFTDPWFQHVQLHLGQVNLRVAGGAKRPSANE